MGNYFFKRIILLALIAIIWGAETSAAPRVVVIGIDGLNSRSLKKVKIPTLEALIQAGSFTSQSRSIRPTVSAPNWASLITGSTVAQHGVTSNDWTRENYLLPPVTTGCEDIFPTIFSVLHLQKPEAKMGVFYQWSGFSKLYENSIVNAQGGDESAEKTVQMAMDYWIHDQPDLLFIHIDDMDAAGHQYGHDSSEYLVALTHVDQLIQKIILLIRQTESEPNTVIFIASDHGGIGKGHGGDTIEEITTPVIIQGPGIKIGYQIPHPIYIFDLAPTIARVLGVVPPIAWAGKVIQSIFTGNELKDHPFDQGVPIPTLEPEEGLFDNPVVVSFVKPALDGVKIRFTLDGSLPQRNSQLYVDPILIERSTVLRARAWIADRYSPVMTASVRIKEKDPKNGILAYYYETETLDFLPDFSALERLNVTPITTQQIDIESLPYRSERFAVRFKGDLSIDVEGDYTFYLRSDDGSRLTVDGHVVVDNDGTHGIRENVNTVNLKKGIHSILVDYFQNSGNAFLKVLYSGPQTVMQIIPPHVLQHL